MLWVTEAIKPSVSRSEPRVAKRLENTGVTPVTHRYGRRNTRNPLQRRGVALVSYEVTLIYIYSIYKGYIYF